MFDMPSGAYYHVKRPETKLTELLFLGDKTARQHKKNLVYLCEDFDFSQFQDVLVLFEKTFQEWKLL